jgi:alkylhydroperoxidase/carboxymuconolactone decarboxylase family protein YurZ
VFTPAIDVFLKEHLFADIFWRDNMDILDREIATVAALCSVEGVDPMLQFHMGAALNVGLKESEMKDLLSVIETRVGEKEGSNGRKVFSRVLAARTAKQ